MGLKIATTVSMLTGVVLLLLWNTMVGVKPGDGAPKAELRAYGLRLITQFGLTAGAFICAAIFAMLLARKTRLVFATELRSNVADLMEGTLRDHGGSKLPDDAPSD